MDKKKILKYAFAAGVTIGIVIAVVILISGTGKKAGAKEAGPEAVVEAFLKENPNFTTEPLALPDVFPQNTSGMLTLVPGEYDTDGFFICRMRRNS